MAKTRKKSAHYVNNKELYLAMIEYRKGYDIYAANGAIGKPPRVPNYIGECIMKIATHLAYKPNFANYPFREEMISDGIENCLQYIHNFNPAKSKNPFAYFTTTIGRAFIRRIQKEKRYLYAKHVATQMAEINNITADAQEHDERRNSYKSDVSGSEWSQEQMARFMEDFEEKKRRRRKRKAEDDNLAAPI